LPSAATPKFSELALHADELDGDEGQAEDIHRLLVEFSDEELLATFAEMVKQEVGEILRVAPDKIDSSRPIQLMGLDSLMGVELAVALESRFGVRLPVMVLSENPSIDKLAVRILAQLRGNEETESAADGMLNQVRRTLAQHAPEVGADAMTRFAEDLQTGNEAGWRMIQ
jgi:acyl carrier protein